MSEIVGNLAGKPSTYNPLSELNYKLTLNRGASFTYFTQNVTLPTITLPPVQVGTPFQDMRLAGDHIDVKPLQVEFMVDENMDNYFFLWEWLVELGYPNDYQQYADINNRQAKYVDATLTVFNNIKQPSRYINFQQLYPIALASPSSFTSTDASVYYVRSQAQFLFQSISVEKAGSAKSKIL